ncbi:MAG: PDZ domain-containing protein [Gemmatimonadales bacterium]|nr:PDZ domain-containing protein [Gemmatimonadales bacterium]
MKRLFIAQLFVLLLISMTGLCLAAAADAPPGYVMRFADIGHGQIVFTYEDDLWLVPDTGGAARRITSHEGREIGAKFSPDGKQLAFTASYDGGTDIYLMDALGGVPRRVTYHPGGSILLDWCPDGKGLIFRANRVAPGYSNELYRINVAGGMATRLPVDRGSLASVAPDRSGIAYNRLGRHTRTWKRYEGGLAQDIWVKDFKSGDISRITDWQGSDQFPMWGEGAIYFASDRDNATLNIYRYDTTSKKTTPLTTYKKFDVKYPSLGENKIIYQHGPGLTVLDLANGKPTQVPITIPSDRRHVRSELIQAEPGGSFGLSPAGERAVVEARGEILNLPADDGDALNLTRNSGTREKDAAWSPDGRWIAMVSDRSGEQQVYLVDQRGEKDWRQVTDGFYGFINQPVWSPDSKYLVFSDKFMKLYLVDVEGKDVKEIAHSDYDDAWERWGIMDYVWSPDSRWMAYTSQTGNMNEAIWLYDVKGGKNTQITGDMTEDWSPSFSRDGKYLFFLSNRTFHPIMGRQDQNHIFLKTALPYMILLQDGTRSPFHKDDVAVAVTGGDGEGEKDEKEDGDGDADTVIDFKGLGDRVLVCDGFEPDNYFRLEAIEGGFVVLRKPDPVFIKYQNVNDHTADALDLLGYKLDDGEVTDLMTGVANYHLSADGKKLIYRAGEDLGIVDAGKPAKSGDGKLDAGAVKLRIDRLAEFPNIFAEAWRIQRDWFYDQNMHGVDWQAMYDKYSPFVAGCGTRGDLNFLIGEMISELNIGHTYIFGGDYEDTGERLHGGLLGCDFAAEEDRDYYKITDIVRGVSWDPRYRSPLTEPGVGIDEGDFLIAIDGVEVKVGDNVFELLVDKAGAMVSLTTSNKPESKGAATVRVRALRGEYGLRYRAWVDENLDYVTKKTDGEIGYIHLPNMGEPGLTEFGRSWYPQTGKKAMIIDDRFNGGGFVGDMIIDRLERRLWSMTQPREGNPGRNPERDFHGPLVVLINEDTYSNGEFFAEAVKRLGLATTIGVRTWGGSTGIEPHQDMVDGGGTTPPQFGLYGLDGSWPIEGWGVEPDIVVLNLPKDVVADKDSQLDAAIEFLQKQLEKSGGQWAIPGPPAYLDKAKPNLSGGLLK